MNMFRFAITFLVTSLVVFVSECLFLRFWMTRYYFGDRKKKSSRRHGKRLPQKYKNFWRTSKSFHAYCRQRRKSGQDRTPELTSFFTEYDNLIDECVHNKWKFLLDLTVNAVVTALFTGVFASISPETFTFVEEKLIPAFLQAYCLPYKIMIPLLCGLPIAVCAREFWVDWKAKNCRAYTDYLEVYNREILNHFDIAYSTSVGAADDDSITKENSQENVSEAGRTRKSLLIAAFLSVWVAGVLFFYSSYHTLFHVVDWNDLWPIDRWGFAYFFSPATLFSMAFAGLGLLLYNLHNFLYVASMTEASGDIAGRIRERWSQVVRIALDSSLLSKQEDVENWLHSFEGEFTEMCQTLRIRTIDIYLYEDFKKRDVAGAFKQESGRSAVMLNLGNPDLKSFERLKEYHEIILLLFGHELAHISAGDYSSRRRKYVALCFAGIWLFSGIILLYTLYQYRASLLFWPLLVPVLIMEYFGPRFLSNSVMDTRCWDQVKEFRADRIGYRLAKAKDLSAFLKLKKLQTLSTTQDSYYPSWEARIRELERYKEKKWTIGDDFHYFRKFASQIQHDHENWRL